MNKRRIITIRHLIIKGKRKIAFDYRADPTISAIIKGLDGVKWDIESRFSYIENKKDNLNIVYSIFKGVAWIDGKYFFLNKPINTKIEEPNYSAKKEYNLREGKKCPDEYIDKLQVLRYSKNTLNVYVSLFEKFINFYENKKLISLDENDINIYMKHLVISKKSHSFQNLSINAIKFYFEIVLGLPNRYYRIERPRKKEILPTVLSVAEVSRIIKVVENIKHKAILITIYSAGLRISECMNLKIRDINSDRKLIFVRNSKGGKDRYSILGDRTIEILRKYYKTHKPSEYLFEGQMGGKYSVSSVRKILKRALKKANINTPATIHTLRHSFATHLLEKGVNLRYIQNLLGHASPKTTEIYTRVSSTGISEIINPIDQLDL